VVDLDEYHQTPNLYEALELPEWVERLPDAWLVVPLQFREALIGLLLLGHSEVQKSLNWEDRDLLKMAGKQAAVHLAQHQSDQALMQARQFEAFNRLSAYIAHDLKNILAQQSLIVANADRHKHNPAFVDDVIETVRNSVERMTRLMTQMRQGTRGGQAELVPLDRLLQRVVEGRAGYRPVPALELPAQPLCVEADPEQLATVFGHLVQNAQEATADDGRVSVRLSADDGQAIIAVEDTGTGMDAQFIAERLFKPFDSTKGLTGMGIGMFESREYIRALGGEIEVRSTPGEGSLFRIRLPLRPCDGAHRETDGREH
jgi:putative PEP-CTERM system histidine kinase